MTYMYYCPQCDSFVEGDSEQPKESGEHTICRGLVCYTGYTKADWQNVTDEEKEALKIRLQIKAVQADARESVKWQKEMAQDIHTIHHIMVFFTVMWVFSIFICILLMFLR
jgi:hypothetical protein